jgi:hypothetical protein
MWRECNTNSEYVYISHPDLQIDDNLYEDYMHIDKDRGTGTFVREITQLLRQRKPPRDTQTAVSSQQKCSHGSNKWSR